MQYKETVIRLVFLLFPSIAFSQTTYLPQGARENVLLERLEIKAGTDSVLNYSKARPFSRRHFITAAQRLDTSVTLSRVDAYNLYMAKVNNIEYAMDRDSLRSKKVFLNRFYKTPGNFYEVNEKDFRLVLNPVFQYTVGKEKDNSEHLFLNTRGIHLRGMIAEKIGFSAYITDNQERDPQYVQQWVTERKAVPGQGFYKDFKGTGYDYFDARGSISFNAAKYIDITFGYDKNFIGNGYRSLFLSDFSNNALFLKVNTRIWKFNYQNLFMELVNAQRKPVDVYLPKKYAAIHHLDIGVTKWLNIGLFEGIVFGRSDHFEFGYLNPVIFYRSVEQQSGSVDNALAGLDAKANLAKHVQLYGQLLLDEFRLDELKNKWWGNKFGYQVGAKYIDAFDIDNLDIQAEFNRVRPFTYTHRDSIANYTHNNQPMAHPFGASFNEVIAMLRFQPIPRLMMQAKAIYYKQGKDTSAANYGSNIFLPNVPPFRTLDYGFEVGSGALSKVGYASFLLSYELKPNFFIEANTVYRKQNALPGTAEKSTVIFNAGVRWNMHRREFDF